MSKLESIIINENGFSFDPFTGETYTINQLGVQILKKLKTGMEKVRLAKQLAKKYNRSFEDVYQDLYDFCEQLKIYGIV